MKLVCECCRTFACKTYGKAGFQSSKTAGEHCRQFACERCGKLFSKRQSQQVIAKSTTANFAVKSSKHLEEPKTADMATIAKDESSI